MTESLSYVLGFSGSLSQGVGFFNAFFKLHSGSCVTGGFFDE